MAILQKITPCLWFDNQAQEAANFYVSIFNNSGIETITRYGKEGFEKHGKPEGSVLTVTFRLEGQTFTALNGGPLFKFNEAVSFQVSCDTQDEIDHFWGSLSTGGDPKAQQCGWLKDKYGVSWHIVPRVLSAMLTDPDHEKSGRAMKAMLNMKQLDIAALERAFAG